MTDKMPRLRPSRPPGPRLLAPSVLAFFRHPLRYFQSLSARYGDPFSIPFALGGRMTVTGCPLHIATLFKAKAEQYGAVDEMGSLFYGEEALMSLNGKDHQVLRRHLMVARLRKPTPLAPMIRDATLNAFELLPIGGTFAVMPSARDLIFEIILGAVFGAMSKEERAQFWQAFTQLHGKLGFFAVFLKALRKDLGPWSPWGGFLRARQRCHELIDERIQRSRQRPSKDPDCLIDDWISLKAPDGAPVLSDQQIRENVMAFLFAGHDSTSVALTWCLYWTHYEPGVRLALLDELGDYVQTLDVSQLESTPYLDGLCYEALRMNPIAPGVARRLKAPMTLGDIEVPAGDVVMASIDLACNDPEVYPLPQQFHPERYLDGAIHPRQLIHFGGGDRRCPGAELALLELRVAVATLMARYRFSLVRHQALRGKWSHGIRKPAEDILMRLEDRRHIGSVLRSTPPDSQP